MNVKRLSESLAFFCIFIIIQKNIHYDKKLLCSLVLSVAISLSSVAQTQQVDLMNNELMVQDMVCLAMNDCNSQSGNGNTDFLGKFYDVLTINQPNAVFQYQVTNVDSSTKQLKITNEDGD